MRAPHVFWAVAELKLDGRERLVLGGDQEFAVKREQAWAATERFFGTDARHVGVVVVLGQVREYQIARTAVESFGIGEESAYGFIRKMPGAAHDTLFHVPGIGPDLQHFHIVIGFEDYSVTVA